MNKHILFLCLIIQMNAKCQLLDTTNYHVYFYDEFDYPDLTSGICPYTSLGTTAGTTFLSNWSIETEWRAGEITTDVNQVSLSTSGSSPSFISLTENYYPDSLLYPIYDPTTGAITGYRSRKTGMIRMNWSNEFSYGILEARIKFPDITDSASLSNSLWQAAFPSFWTFSHSKTEIDIFDDALFDDWVVNKLIDWFYYDRMGYPKTYTVGYASPNINAFPINISNLTGWHTYSAQWTPTDVSYYIDGHYLTDIPYSYNRTYPGNASIPESQSILELILWANRFTKDGQHVDIDWVKVWKQNCYSGAVLNVSTVTIGTSSVIVPGMYKHNPIIASSSSLVSTATNNATIFESPSTLIESNFIADESTLNSGYFTLDTFPSGTAPNGSKNPYGPVFKNGFLEILPTNCVNRAGETGYRVGFDSVNQNNNIKALSYSIYQFNHQSIENDSNSNLNSSFKIEVYPNPTQKNIYISFTCNSSGELDISIKDVSGRMLYVENVNCESDKQFLRILDMSPFVPGIYIIDLTLNDQHVVKKIVKL